MCIRADGGRAFDIRVAPALARFSEPLWLESRGNIEFTWLVAFDVVILAHLFATI